MIYNVCVIIFSEVSAMKKTLKSVICCILSCLMIFSSSALAFAADGETTPVIVVNDINCNPIVTDSDEVVFDFSSLNMPNYFMKPFSEDIYEVFKPDNLKSFVGEDGQIDFLGAAMAILGAVGITDDVLDLVAKVTTIYGEISGVIDFKNLDKIDYAQVKALIDKYIDEYNAKKQAFIDSVKALAMNPDGTPADDTLGAGEYPKAVSRYSSDELFELRTSELLTGVADSIGEENTYLFLYDWRLDPLENAAKLNEFVKNVKSNSGSDKVRMLSEGYGSLIATAYFSQYASEAASDIDNYVSVSSSFLGSSIFGDLYCGELMSNESDINVRTSAVIRYINDRSDNPITFGIGWLVSYILNREWEMQSFTYDYTKLLQEYAQTYIYGEFSALFENAPGLWALVPEDRYQDAVAYTFGSADKANADLMAKTDAFKAIQATGGDSLVKAQKNGVNVHVVALWDIQILPVGETNAVQSDGLIDTYSQSYGASCIDINALQEARLVVQERDNDHDHLSDTFKTQDPRFTIAGIGHFIDASVCALPENTWFIANMKHNTFNSESNTMQFILWLLESGTQRTVWDNNKYPQFLSINRYIGTGGTLRIDDGNGSLTPGAFLLGDIDLDGKVTAYDSLLADKIASGELTFEEGSLPLKNGDVDGDGEVTEKDADLIINISAGLNSEFTSGVDITIPEANTENLRIANATIRTVTTYNAVADTMTLKLYAKNVQDESTANLVINYDENMFDFKSCEVKDAASGVVVAGKPEGIDGVITCAYKFIGDVADEDFDDNNEMLLATYNFDVKKTVGETVIKAGSTFMTESGEKVYCTGAKTEIKKEFFYLLGDVNGDHNVTTLDARYVLRMAARLEATPEELFAVADVNHDGKITPADARMILRVAARLDHFDDSAESGNIRVAESVDI